MENGVNSKLEKLINCSNEIISFGEQYKNGINFSPPLYLIQYEDHLVKIIDTGLNLGSAKVIQFRFNCDLSDETIDLILGKLIIISKKLKLNKLKDKLDLIETYPPE